jgi:hypothetical protein
MKWWVESDFLTPNLPLSLRKQRLGDLRHHLKTRGYNDKVIDSGFSKASEIDRNDLLEYTKIKINKRVPLFSLTIPLQKSETLTKLFPEPPVVAFR